MTHSPPRPDTICAVVVTYHPDAGFEDRLLVSARQVSQVVVVDNDSGPDTVARLREIAAGAGNVEVIANPANVGLASALNAGMRWAMQHGYSWVLSLDQDTIPLGDMVATLVAAYQRLRNPGAIAMLGSFPIEPDGTPVLRFRAAPNLVLGVRYVMTAGALLSTAAFTRCGPYRDDFFIDSIDRGYGYRLRSVGYRTVLVLQPGMIHSPGVPSRVRVGPVSLATTNHSALRRYYITRNWLVVLGRYLWADPVYLLREFAWCVYEMAKALCFESDRRNKLRAVVAGIRDAVSGRMGKRAES